MVYFPEAEGVGDGWKGMTVTVPPVLVVVFLSLCTISTIINATMAETIKQMNVKMSLSVAILLLLLIYIIYVIYLLYYFLFFSFFFFWRTRNLRKTRSWCSAFLMFDWTTSTCLSILVSWSVWSLSLPAVSMATLNPFLI